MLTSRYLEGIPKDARAARDPRFLKPEQITKDKIATVRKLDGIARARGQSLAQMALAWVLRKPVVTSALIGASSPAQVEENVAVQEKLAFDESELAAIDTALSPAH